jgi:hypothetical protein
LRGGSERREANGSYNRQGGSFEWARLNRLRKNSFGMVRSVRAQL